MHNATGNILYTVNNWQERTERTEQVFGVFGGRHGAASIMVWAGTACS